MVARLHARGGLGPGRWETIGVYGLDGVRQTLLTVPRGGMRGRNVRPGVVAGRRVAPG